MALAYLKEDARPLEWRQRGWATEIRHKPATPDPEPTRLQRLLIWLGLMKPPIPWRPISEYDGPFIGDKLVIDAKPIEWMDITRHGQEGRTFRHIETGEIRNVASFSELENA